MSLLPEPQFSARLPKEESWVLEMVVQSNCTNGDENDDGDKYGDDDGELVPSLGNCSYKTFLAFYTRFSMALMSGEPLRLCCFPSILSRELLFPGTAW